MGHRHAKPARDGGGSGSGSSDNGPGGEGGSQLVAPPDLLSFIETAPGAKWLAGVLLDLPEHAHNLRATTLAEVNSFVIRKYRDFKQSDIGHRMLRSPQAKHVATQDTLALPVYIVEDLVRQRLIANITRVHWGTGIYLATRVPLMCGVVHAAKAAVKRFVLRPHRAGGRRTRRLVRAAEFVLDTLLPTAFYGPLLTYGLLTRKLVKELDEG